jgi:broad specificity phosphatase PhoE
MRAVYVPPVRLLLLARHGQSLFNVEGVVNGDPARDQGLSDAGRTAAGALGLQLAALTIDLCVTSRFPRAQETARLALGTRPPVPTIVDEDLDDVRIGELEGKTLADYREWKHLHSRHDRFPGGESLDEAARRYAAAFERLADRPEPTVLCVCHEIPVRYAVNAADGSDDLDFPTHKVANATPYVFDPAGLRRAVERMRQLAAAEHVERAQG